MNYLPEQTIRYKTYLKTSLVEAFRPVFTNHVDDLLTGVKVTIDFPRTRASYPALLVRYFERSINNAGVGHYEFILDDTVTPNQHMRFKHFFYKGDVELAIYALSSLDRDLISDTVVQTLAMGDLTAYTNAFFNRIYPGPPGTAGQEGNFIHVNTDEITPFGESQQPVPWQSEDDLVYQVSYRCQVWGEIYSLPPAPAGLITRAPFYPYISDVEPEPTGDPNDAGAWTEFIGFVDPLTTRLRIADDGFTH